MDPSVDGSSRRDLPHGLYEGRGGGGGAADVSPSLQNTQVSMPLHLTLFVFKFHGSVFLSCSFSVAVILEDSSFLYS